MVSQQGFSKEGIATIMAQSAKIAALTDELIHSILRFDPETSKQAYKRAKDTATRALRAQQYARTNQFDVQASYIGLDEKFRVLNRDDLADALDKRVKEIYQLPGKRIPEHLSLLLLLSDQPTQKTNVGALELLRPPTPPLDLTWKQILEEDPYSDEELWKDVEYGAGSSEEEEIPTKPAKWNGTPATRGEEEDVYDAEACLAPVGLERLKPIKDAQFWKQRVSEQEDKVAITELQAVRETLFMLAGFPTSLYHVDKQSNNVRVNQKYVLSHMMHRTADSLFSHLTDIGGRLYRLRQWIEQPSSLPLIQTLEAAVRTRLAEYDRMLALLQCKFLVPDTSVTVSLLELREELQTASRPILRLAQLLAEIEPQLLVNPFIHLEILFDQINLAQMTLEKDVFDFLSRIFFECLQIYLKPIRRWMALGELGLNDETFFVFENDSGSEVSSLWHDRFVLRRGKANALRSPTFLQPAALKIFNTGKSVVFLREMGIYGAGFYSSEAEPPLAHETVCGSGGEMPLSPFSELFQAAFQTWISSNYSLASTVLREHLFAEAGLMRILNDFKTLYLGADGSLFQDFADAIFERMDAGQRGWNDRFLLTELARGIFSSALSRTQAERIVVRSARSKTQARSVKGLASLSFEYGVRYLVLYIKNATTLTCKATLADNEHHSAHFHPHLPTTLHLPSANLPHKVPRPTHLPATSALDQTSKPASPQLQAPPTSYLVRRYPALVPYRDGHLLERRRHGCGDVEGRGHR